MYCKLCGKHLYEKITFMNLFKMNYDIHDECFKSINNQEYLVFPVLNKLVYFDYLFEERFEKSDANFLYSHYSFILFERMLENREWSIVLILERPLDSKTIALTLKLADKVLLIMNVFYENFM